MKTLAIQTAVVETEESYPTWRQTKSRNPRITDLKLE